MNSSSFSERPITNLQRYNCDNIVKMEKDDSVVLSIVNQFINRANVGFYKYGKTLDRNDLSFLAWVQHAQEENMDSILYLEKMKQMKLKSIF